MKRPRRDSSKLRNTTLFFFDADYADYADCRRLPQIIHSNAAIEQKIICVHLRNQRQKFGWFWRCLALRTVDTRYFARNNSVTFNNTNSLSSALFGSRLDENGRLLSLPTMM